MYVVCLSVSRSVSQSVRYLRAVVTLGGCASTAR